jgi:phage-related minor tail protein
MFDGWTQLNILLDNFKEVLADVGNIFSTAFGPALKVLNEIMEIPFVKSVTAWTIAIGSVAVGYVALIKTINQIKDVLISTNKLQSASPKIIEDIIEK